MAGIQGINAAMSRQVNADNTAWLDALNSKGTAVNAQAKAKVKAKVNANASTSATAVTGVGRLARGGGVKLGPVAPVPLGGVHSGQGNDRTSGDFPLVNGQPTLPAEWGANSWAALVARNQSTMTNEQLLTMFNSEYRLASHYNSATTAQLNRFTSGAGGTVVSMPGSEMSRLVANSGEGQALASSFTDRLQDSAQRQEITSGKVDVSQLKIKVDLSDRLSWGMNPTNPMFGMVGSTDGVSATLLNANYDVGSRKLTGTMRITVVDRFGLSNSDNDSPGQIAMWLLQHQRGFQSFENKIVYDVPVDVTLTAPPAAACNPRFKACPTEL